MSSFVPKPHTPFQWSPQLTPAELHPILGSLRSRLRKRGITFKWHQPELSALEGALSRGDRRIAGVIRSAWEKGCRLDGWTEHFEFQPWVEAFSEHGMDLDAAISRERGLEERLPWDHLTPSGLREFLAQEHRRALQGLPSPACDIDGLGASLASTSRPGRTFWIPSTTTCSSGSRPELTTRSPA